MAKNFGLECLKAALTSISLPIFTLCLTVLYTYQFKFSSNLISFEVLSVSTAESIILFCSFLIMVATRQKWRKPLIMLSFAMVLIFLVFLYCITFISNILWGGTISFELLKSFLLHSSITSQIITTGLSGQLISIPFTVLGFIGLLGTLVWVFSRACFQSCVFLFEQTSIPRVFVFFALTVITSVLVSSTMKYYTNHQSQLCGEPLLSFLGITQINNFVGYDNRKMNEMLKDKIIATKLQGARATKPKNVILIFSDSLRADHTSAYGYAQNTTPFLRKLYEEGKLSRVDTALSMCPDSYCGITTTLSSRPFDEISTGNFNLTDLLHEAGFKIHFFLSGNHRDWEFLWDYYKNKFDHLVDYTTLKKNSLDDDLPLIEAFKQIPQFDGHPHFFYVFLMATHQLGIKSPMYRHFLPADQSNIVMSLLQFSPLIRENGHLMSDNKEITDHDIQIFNNVYDNGIVQTDDSIKQIFTTLSKQGYLQNSIVVIMADHGEALGEHDHFGHNRFLYQEDIRIPILIYSSDGSIPRNIPFATNMDLAPTIASEVGLPIPSTWKGRDLAKPLSESITYHQTRRPNSPCFGVVHWQEGEVKKYVRCRNRNNIYQEMFFNLNRDPSEAQNLLAKSHRAQEIDQYRNRLNARFNPSLQIAH